MPFSSITVKPGVNTVATPTLNMAGIASSNLIRFRMGLVEKMGGWIRYISANMGSIVRALQAWQDLQGNKLLGVGALQSLQVVNNGSSVTNITPTYSIFSPAVNVSTTVGSVSVTIVDANITGSIATFDSVFFNTPISIDGIALYGLYPISVGGVGTYQIKIKYPATTTVAAGGAVPSFTTAAGSAIITVTFNNHNLAVGDDFVFPIPTVVGGITISGVYKIITVPTANTFTISATGVAASTATVSMNGGNAQYVYYLSASTSGSTYRIGTPGPLAAFPVGYGFSRIVTAANQTGNTSLVATDWSLDNWGEILLANPRGGGIYYWSRNSGFLTAALLSTGPAFNNGIFVAMPEQILVAWGSTVSIASVSTDALQDPLVVRWSDSQDFSTWIPSILNQAGSYRISTGSEIRGAIQGSQQAYFFTDIDCWAMQYLGPPLVFGFNRIGTACGVVGPHAIANMYGRTYWMGSNNFFVTSGQGVQDIPCPIWDTIFQNFDLNNQSKCVAAANGAFNEIMFFYPSVTGGTGECDKYAKLNIGDGSWDYGNLARSAWVDQSVLGNPIGADPATFLLQSHENGYDNDGVAMDSFMETGYFAYGDGENFSVIDYFEPDMKWKTVSASASASVAVTLTAAQSPNGATMTSGPLTMTSTTAYLTPRLRGRQIKWRMETTDLGSFWRMGSTRYRYTVDGRR